MKHRSVLTIGALILVIIVLAGRLVPIRTSFYTAGICESQGTIQTRLLEEKFRKTEDMMCNSGALLINETPDTVEHGPNAYERVYLW